MVIALSKTGLVFGAVVIAVFVTVPVLCGGWVLGVVRQRELPPITWTRIGLALSGLAGIGDEGGLLLGPLALIVVAAVSRRYFE